MRAAMAAAEPADEPPGVWPRFHGFRVGAGSRYANSVVTVLPRMIAPAARRRATAAASAPGRVWAKGLAPPVVGMPATSKMSFTPTGTPCSGPRSFPARASARRSRAVGVKDIFDVAGMPTTGGAKPFAHTRPGADAAAVARLRAAGAIILGKTVTTEFAYRDPAPTRNPWNHGHTPGGSSAGSAVAVAARMAPLALGSQTVGSVLRPAAYCGVVGFKGTHGLVPV